MAMDCRADDTDKDDSSEHPQLEQVYRGSISKWGVTIRFCLRVKLWPNTG